MVRVRYLTQVPAPYQKSMSTVSGWGSTNGLRARTSATALARDSASTAVTLTSALPLRQRWTSTDQPDPRASRRSTSVPRADQRTESSGTRSAARTTPVSRNDSAKGSSPLTKGARARDASASHGSLSLWNVRRIGVSVEAIRPW